MRTRIATPVHNTLLLAYVIVAQDGVEPAPDGTTFYIRKGLSPPSVLSFGAHEPKSPVVHLPTKYADSSKPMEDYMFATFAERGIPSKDGYHIYDRTTEQCTCWTAVYAGERNKCTHGMAAELVQNKLCHNQNAAVALETAAIAGIRDFGMQITARERHIPKELQDHVVVSSNAFSVYHHVLGLAKAAEVARVVDVDAAVEITNSLRSEELGDVLDDGAHRSRSVYSLFHFVYSKWANSCTSIHCRQQGRG